MNATPLSASRLGLMTLGLGLGTFLVSLDFAVANVAIPNISGDLAVSPSQGTWAITSFTAANAIALPLTGWLARRFGEVRLFVAAGLLFTLFSLLCGLSPNLETLVVMRVLQGVVSGPMLPLSQSLLLRHFPAHLKGMALAVVSMTVTVAPLTGPIIGGAITDNWSWPWIFFINLPLGLLAAALVWSTLRDRETERARLPIDGVGLALLMIWVTALQVLLDKGQEIDWFASSFGLALGIAAAVALVVFVIWELGDRHPVVDLTLYGDRNFFIGAMATSLPWSILFAGLVVFPLWLQTNMGYTPTWAGVATAAFGVFIMLLTPVVGRLLGRINLKYLLTLSFSLLWLGTYLGSRANTDATLWDAALPRLVQGAGLGMFFVPLLTIALSNMPPQRLAAATGLFYFTRTLAGSIGVSLGITVWDRRETLHHARLAELFGSDALARMWDYGGERMASALPAQYALAERLLARQANMLGFNDLFYASCWLLPPLLLLVWLAKPPFVAAGGRP
ncbi:DHA2 family efflux MFS transporter permease subunit [Immundisolibacter sp.]|uniref:DHA2 family efflux MFS transporter permease subunit n=1 Tax=Immundisolibacter sp. TaxID=1934948 RepID=UPI00260BF89E|nr:DHA2 family efflux MFS transporter permease subunit [Immundisolibacter sp.]MDD3650080.1 DHA2 family efflux MFS transporter permease subunit [Immundisolibacter sp.]